MTKKGDLKFTNFKVVFFSLALDILEKPKVFKCPQFCSFVFLCLYLMPTWRTGEQKDTSSSGKLNKPNDSITNSIEAELDKNLMVNAELTVTEVRNLKKLVIKLEEFHADF